MNIIDRKKAVTTILAKLNNPETGEPHEGVEMKHEGTEVTADQPLFAIAQEAIRAFEQKSPLDLMHALKAFVAQSGVDTDGAEE